MNLYLIGYRGSGKSTIAPRLASALDREFVDTDRMIETQTGQTIGEIFAESGEAEFRRLETKIIRSFTTADNWIVSLGGGAVLAEVNRSCLANSGKTVWLSAPPEILWQRIFSDTTSEERRPNLTNIGGRAEVEQLLAQRMPIYAECADFTIDVSKMSPEQTTDEIVVWWHSVDKNSIS